MPSTSPDQSDFKTAHHVYILYSITVCVYCSEKLVLFAELQKSPSHKPFRKLTTLNMCPEVGVEGLRMQDLPKIYWY